MIKRKQVKLNEFIRICDKYHIEYEKKDETHYRFWLGHVEYDAWPTTEKYRRRGGEATETDLFELLTNWIHNKARL